MCNKPNNQTERKRLVRVRGKGLAVVSLTPELVWSEADPCIRREVSRTLGFPSDFGHSDVEVFYKFSQEPYSNPLLTFIHDNVKKGARYSAGDRLTFKADVWGDEYTIEFRAVKVNGDEMLRAVVLELDGEYQAMSTADAVELIIELYNSEESFFRSLDDLEDLSDSGVKS